ncbi:MAG: insulinase family protein [Planctomycetes bacterium]|nr:insulinase family protein [Planctomycetota bacterium]
MREMVPLLTAAILSGFLPALAAQHVPVQVHTLENGLRLLMLPRPGEPNVAAGWIARVGSVDERPGITGTAHLFEHMMFKGTRVIGTSDIDRDLEIIAELDRLRTDLQIEQEKLQERHRLGEISDPSDPAARSPRHRELLEEFQKLLAEQKSIIVKDEFDKVYTAAGASGMNAGTSEDFTVYFINVPANKLELWFWMESDRLLNPVFREFYSERDVVREERRLRVESTPTGRFEEQFDALFWTSSPYAWPVIGWPSDVEAITRDEALAFYSVYYAPNNVTACLVGDFRIEDAIRLADRYLGRLPRGPRPPATVRTLEIEQAAEKRMIARAETRPTAVVRFHTVADGHRDEPALVVLQELLNGRTGRLYKSLILEQEIANSAHARQRGRKYEGSFEVRAVAKPGKDPVEVEQAILDLLDGLREETIGERELEKVKNQLAADEFRKLRANFSLLLQLLVRDSMRGWETINTDPPRLQAVTADDVRRVVSAYFRPENRSVLLFYTKEGGER